MMPAKIKQFTGGSLFSGIGALDLAAEMAGIEIMWQIEINSFCQKVLKKNFKYIKRRGHDIKSKDPTRYEPVDIIFGGPPCQPFSNAGKRRGAEDDRNLWPEMLRFVKHLKPTWVLVENVPGINSMGKPMGKPKMEAAACLPISEGALPGFIYSYEEDMVVSEIISDLEKEGYQLPRTWDGTPVIPVIPACSRGAQHRRDRVWIIAHRYGERAQISDERGLTRVKQSNGYSEKDVFGPDNSGNGSQGDVYREWTDTKAKEDIQERYKLHRIPPNHWGIGNFAPRTCGTYDGITHRVDRVKGIGNSVFVPAAYTILKSIVQLEAPK